MTKHIVTLPDHGLGSRSQEMRCKHWIKILTGVDRSKTDGYAFQGDFARFESTVEIAEGTWLLAFREDRSGAGRLRGIEVTLYQIQAGEAATIEEWELGPQGGWALHVRDKIADYMETTPEPAPVDDRPEMTTISAPVAPDAYVRWLAGKLLALAHQIAMAPATVPLDGDHRAQLAEAAQALTTALTPTAPEPTEAELLAERERMFARIAEIDTKLPEPEGTEVTTRQAAQALGVSVRTIQRWAAAGKVQAVKDPVGRWIITITINA